MENVLTGINTTHTEDQKEVNDANGANQQINTDLKTKLDEGGTINQASVDATKAQAAHNTCRTEQARLLVIKDEKNTSLRTAVQLSKAPDCIKEFLPPTLDNIPKKVTCIQAVAKWAKTTNESLVTKFAAFNAATDAYNTEEAACVKSQQKLETDFCAYTTKFDAGCKKHASDFKTKRTASDDVYAAVKVSEQARKMQYVSASHIICFADIILLTHTTNRFKTDVTAMTNKLAECKKATPSTSHLVITYPDHPSAIDCVGPIPTASRPCDDTWNTERYKSQKWFETVPTICASDRACPATQ